MVGWITTLGRRWRVITLHDENPEVRGRPDVVPVRGGADLLSHQPGRRRPTETSDTAT